MKERGSRRVTIVGAGIAGLVMASLLSDRGWHVRVFEKRDLCRLERGHGPSINLALSHRGLRTLERIGLSAALQPFLVPMHGRLVHAGGEPTFHPYDLAGGQAIWSVRRVDLLRLLLAAARRRRVEIAFERCCAGADLDDGLLELTDGSRVSFDVVLGADGAPSAIRDAIARHHDSSTTQCLLDHGYQEMTITPDRARVLAPGALHVWPRRDFMLIALPNRDASFTATLFLPLVGGETTFQALAGPGAAQRFFETHFADAAALLPTTHTAAPIGRLVTISCERWHAGGRAVLIGDAAHAMTPFYGQGMNCALEDCLILDELWKSQPDTESAFATFERNRRADVEAIADLSIANYREMREGVLDDEFERTREIERALLRRHPDRFLPLYAMIAFTSLPYAEARARAELQRKVVAALADPAAVESPRSDDLVRSLLPVARPAQEPAA